MSAFDDHLDAPWDALEPAIMIEDLKAFLDLSESKLESLYQKEIHRIEQTRETEGFEYPEDEEHLATRANQRFKVFLPLLARYGALASVVSDFRRVVRQAADFSVARRNDCR